MATFSTHAITDLLVLGFQTVNKEIGKISKLSEDLTLRQPAPGAWSAVEVVAHLNYYSRIYNVRFAAATGRYAGTGKGHFKTGWLGDYFVGIMEPKADGVISGKMKAPATSRPRTGLVPESVFSEFFNLQAETMALVTHSTGVDLQRIRISTMLPLVSLRMGDAFRFLLAHQQRHLVQAQRAAGILPSRS